MSIWTGTNKSMESLIEDIKAKFQDIKTVLHPSDAGEVWMEKREIDALIKDLRHFRELLINYRDLGKRIGKTDEAERISVLIRILKDMKPSPEWVKTVLSYFSLIGVELDATEKILDEEESHNAFLICLSSGRLIPYDISGMELYFCRDGDTRMSVQGEPGKVTVGKLFYDAQKKDYYLQYGYHDKEKNAFVKQPPKTLGRIELIIPESKQNVHHFEFMFTRTRPTLVKKVGKHGMKFQIAEPVLQAKSNARCKCGTIQGPWDHYCPSCGEQLLDEFHEAEVFEIQGKKARISVAFAPTMFDSLGTIRSHYLLWSLVQTKFDIGKVVHNPMYPDSERGLRENYLHYMQKVFLNVLQHYANYLKSDFSSFEITFDTQEIGTVASYLPFRSRPNKALFRISFLSYVKEVALGKKSEIYSTIKHEMTHHLRIDQMQVNENALRSLSSATKRGDERLTRLAEFHLFIEEFIEEGLAVFAQGASSSAGEAITPGDLAQFHSNIVNLFLNSSLNRKMKEHLEYRLCYRDAHALITYAFLYYLEETGKSDLVQVQGLKESFGKFEPNGNFYPVRDIGKALRTEKYLSFTSSPPGITKAFLDHINNMNRFQIISYAEFACKHLRVPEEYLLLTHRFKTGIFLRIHLTFSNVTCEKCLSVNNALSKTCRNCNSPLKFDPKVRCSSCSEVIDVEMIWCPHCGVCQFEEVDVYKEHKKEFLKMAS